MTPTPIEGIGAGSRRIAKQEVVSGQTKKWFYLYDGWNIIAVMNENGRLLETSTRKGGGQ